MALEMPLYVFISKVLEMNKYAKYLMNKLKRMATNMLCLVLWIAAWKFPGKTSTWKYWEIIVENDRPWKIIKFLERLYKRHPQDFSN